MKEKDIKHIEDMMLQFTDSGELIKYSVHKQPLFTEFTQNVEAIRLHIVPNEDIICLDKVKLIDKIFNRIRRKYKGIFIFQNMIIIIPDDIEEAKLVPTDLLEDKLINILSYYFSDIHTYRLDEETIPNLTEYGKDRDNLFYIYNKRAKQVTITSKKLYNEFKDGFCLTNSEILMIITDKIKSISNLEIESTHKFFKI